MSFPRYERYKESGIDWLGEVPEHWEINRLKATVERCKNGIWGEDEQGDSWDMPCVRVADFDRVHLKVKTRVPTIRNIGASERTGRVIVRGDLLLEKSGGGDLQPVGFVVLYDNDQEAVCSNFVARMQLAKEMSSSYGRYLHATLYDLRLNTRSINQTSGIQNLDQASYLNEVVTIPPPEEQFFVARFLDYETGKIDALIEEQRRLIELLKEKRQAVISHAVTKGLNPSASMKNSGFAWLGLVPEHWEVGPIKRWFQTSSGGTPSTSDYDRLYATEGGHPWIRTTDLNDEPLNTYEIAITEEGMNASACILLPLGSVLIAMYGGGGTIGKNAILMITACINQALCSLLPNDKFDQSFTFRFIQFYRPSWMIGAVSSRIDPNISQDLIKNSPFLHPPLSEQRAIARFLSDTLSRFDQMENQAAVGIALLQERRSALISAAVTGKIDVRRYAKQTGEAA